MITDRLDTYSLLSLKLSCRRFYHTPPEMSFLIEEARKDPSLMFRYLCMLEDVQSRFLRSPQILACSGCKRLHGRRLFIHTESEKQPDSRQCIGWQKQLMITPSIGISFSDLTLMMPVHRRHLMPIITHPYLCNSFHSVVDTPGIPDYVLLLHIYVRNDIHFRKRCHVLYTWKYSFERPQCQKKIKTSLERQLKHVRIDFCLHTKSSCRALVRITINGMLCNEMEGFDYRCKKCETAMRIVCNGPKMEAEFWIKREIGTVESAADPKWITQIQP